MRTSATLLAALLLAGIAGCGDDGAEAPAPPAPTSASPAAQPDPDARLALAGRAALAADRSYTAVYTYDASGQGERSVMATVAADGGWRVDIPGGALGGAADVAIAETAAGLFQCALSSAAYAITPSCVRLGDKGERVPKKFDPKIERVFRQWLPVFTDRQAALSVGMALPLDGSSGQCYSVDSISASLSAPVDVGIYCYADDGLLTAARVTFGTITLAGTPAAGPATIDLPGPVTGGEPLGLDAPPAPPVTSLPVPSPSA
ncbi:hypothetical protein [Symbioplanes lichenis]|uniref:hypothetical protein n=1 Tax=Symbioplanes lichenis TaxID=1629072 RepID=UPI002738DD74|nr:hypothetical protein [Actinoplanes lichenis]